MTVDTVLAVLRIIFPRARHEAWHHPVGDTIHVTQHYELDAGLLAQASQRGTGLMLEELLAQVDGNASRRLERARLYVEQKRIPFSQRAGRRSGPRLRFYRRFADQELDR